MLVRSQLQLLVLLLARSVANATTLRSGNLNLTVAADGAYSVAADGAPWLHSAPPTLLGKALLALPATLRTGHGADALGDFANASLQWALAGAAADSDSGGGAVLSTEFAAYAAGGASPSGWDDRLGERLRFSFTLLRAAAPPSAYNQSDGASAGTALVGFPAWRTAPAARTGGRRGTGGDLQLNALAFGGCQIQFSGVQRWGSKLGGGLQTGMPLTLHDATLRR